jgi:ABC-type uncharacterized transport system substrate-binding protein
MDDRMMRKDKRLLLVRLVAAIILYTTLLCILDGDIQWSRESHAHPHAFILQRLTVLFDEKGMAGIRVWWKFDDMFSKMIIEDHDKNRNGRFEDGEVQAIKESAFEQISQYNYFTFIKIDGSSFKVRFIKDFMAILKNQRLVYEFTVPCHVTATQQPKKATIACYDPTYYTAIFFAKNNPVDLLPDGAFEVQTAIREDPDTLIYFDMIHPWALFLKFWAKE